MRLVYRDELFDAQLLRTLSHACYGAADVTECLTAARSIPELDVERWYAVWFALAERIRADAERSLVKGHPVSAQDAFLRASNYYRNAYIFHFGQPQQDELRRAYDLHRETFRQSVAPGEEIAIPYEGTRLHGYFFRAADEPRPTLILNGGYDSTAEECYLWNGIAALRRGYHCLVFDGPGQGSALIEQGLPFRPDWEAVIRPVVDWLLARSDVPHDSIGIIGLSFGGYLALRAATGEPRLAACVADPGQFSLLEIFQSRLPGFLALSLPEAHGLAGWLLIKVMHRRLPHPTGGWALRRGLWTHGLASIEDYLRETARYTLDGRVTQIRCPTLICQAEDDDLAITARKVYDALTCDKDFLLFRRDQGAGAHCEAGARLLFHQRMFDWLGERLQ